MKVSKGPKDILTLVCYNTINKELGLEVVKHGDEKAILGRNVVFVDGELHLEGSCKFCNNLIRRMINRHQPWWEDRQWKK